MIEEKTPKREPVEWVCENGEACKHGWWCSEVYCQEYCHFRNTPAPTPAPGNLRPAPWASTWNISELDVLAKGKKDKP